MSRRNGVNGVQTVLKLDGDDDEEDGIYGIEYFMDKSGQGDRGEMMYLTDKIRQFGSSDQTHNTEHLHDDILEPDNMYHINIDDKNEAHSMYNENVNFNIKTRRNARTTRLRMLLARWRGETM